MRPGLWNPPVEPSPAEQTVIRLVRRAKLFVFLRRRRHELFDEAFQRELAALYAEAARGQPPVPPAQLALALILQAYTGASDDEVVEACVMDRRWQLVLDCLDADDPPFSKGTLGRCGAKASAWSTCCAPRKRSTRPSSASTNCSTTHAR